MKPASPVLKTRVDLPLMHDFFPMIFSRLGAVKRFGTAAGGFCADDFRAADDSTCAMHTVDAICAACRVAIKTCVDVVARTVDAMDAADDFCTADDFCAPREDSPR